MSDFPKERNAFVDFLCANYDGDEIIDGNTTMQSEATREAIKKHEKETRAQIDKLIKTRFREMMLAFTEKEFLLFRKEWMHDVDEKDESG